MTLPERLRLRPPKARLSDREWLWLWGDNMELISAFDAVLARYPRGSLVPWRQA